jgi:hypothetical protein
MIRNHEYSKGFTRRVICARSPEQSATRTERIRPTFGPTISQKLAQIGPNSAELGQAEDLMMVLATMLKIKSLHSKIWYAR